MFAVVKPRVKLMSTLTIDSFVIGPGRPTFVIAEIGVNHDGVLQKALDLVRIAQTCGADAVKLQIFRAVNLMHTSCGMADYQKDRLPGETAIDMLRRYEMSSDDIAKVVKLIRELKMVPLVTPFSLPDLDAVERFRIPAVKIASPDLVNRPLLAGAARLARPMIVSTGAASMDEVQTTVDWLREWKSEFALLHCVSSYPVPPQQANLCWIEELTRKFEVPAGYSDHTNSPIAGAMAAAAGALIVEKHITHDRAARGPDHAASIDPIQFGRYVRLVREADALRGAPGKHVLDIEQDVRKVSRQSLVLRRTLAPGDYIREEDLTVQRPGTGLSAALIDQAIGRKLARPVNAGSLLEWDMLEAA